MDDDARASFEALDVSDRLGKGCLIWVYISPQNNTAAIVKDWTVTLRQGDWSATVTPADNPPIVQTPGLSGEFDVTVAWAKPPSTVVVRLQPLPDSQPTVGCNSNCAAMVGIVADESGQTAHYWTVWDAYCG